MKKYRIEGLDCPKCAAKLEGQLKRSGVDARIDFSSSTLIIDSQTFEEVEEIIHKHSPEITLLESPGVEKDLPVKELVKLLFSGVLFFIALVFSPFLHGNNELLEYGLFVTAYLVAGGNTVLKASRNLLKGDLFDESFLMTVATMGAFVIHELPEAVAVMIFYGFGELLEAMALRKSRRSVKELIDLRAEEVNQIIDGKLRTVPASQIQPGDRFVVRPGERIPIDGLINSGRTWLDKSLLTGESSPVPVEEGDTVLAGTINKSSVIEVTASTNLKKSYTSRMLELVEEGTSRKSSKERFITRFSRLYTPIVVSIATAIAVFPPLLFGGELSDWVHKALVLLVISCPCALVISVPLCYFVGIGKASREGILFKGSNYLESLGKIDSIFIDKTGTLTKGKPEISQIETSGRYDKRELLEYAALMESYSTHPVASSFRGLNPEIPEEMKISHHTEIAGKGITAEINGMKMGIGNSSLLEDLGVDYEERDVSGKIFLSIDGRVEGVFTLSDFLKDDSADAIIKLRELGINEIVMLTGDSYDIAASISAELDLDSLISEATPEDKMKAVESAIARGKQTAFVGDGINDAPVIARADVGIAMGASGADATIETADIVLSDDSLSKVARAIEISRFTNITAVQNIVMSIGIKIIFMTLGTFGLMNMWGAVFADVGVTLLAVLNSLRLLGK
ncbi:MAG TPA: cadmium-translocating P-type ATPase [Mesotoga infera]|jgi:Cd2+/Zn2+-exporting ATPase|uniref:Cadmium-translocating P-type ATPase n=1 Tax=Mesotoga infera TaxID=1236046 RepID=A0A101GZV1_9BACT|nr:MAG: Heavy metal-translocating P-type ATPase, Cd/Co/Hg/Pb/Zn-transporting [Mesotoga infera]KUK90767.1 MAG: Heavy metal-translocating P-type ATPase, Cd/Co/Hg/Pb/Zn-transporting [Mesotoga infera]HCO69025.1 cadmium-translocating P-type ATPase [Mesotoga infera]